MDTYNLILIMGVLVLIILLAQKYMKKYNIIDMDNIDVSPYFRKTYKYIKNLKYNKKTPKIIKNTGNNSLILLNTGENKATLMATLRQITGIDYQNAKAIIEASPTKFMVNISEKEAELTKKALEFVGAKIEIEKDEK